MTFVIQDVLATLVALLAAAFILRRVIGTFAPDKAGQPCASCPSGCAASARGGAQRVGSPPGLTPERPTFGESSSSGTTV